MSNGIGCQCHASSACECSCDGVDWRSTREIELEAENRRLREQVAHLSLYQPARRVEQKPEPVKSIRPTNFAFYGIIETDEEFAARAGTQING